MEELKADLEDVKEAVGPQGHHTQRNGDSLTEKGA